MQSKLITLTTDFGYRDPYVGVMKGVILGINPAACIVDLTHGLPPQDVMAAALSLRASVRYFPRGTTHVAVVDPGVGTKRRPLLIASEETFFVGPDNGIFSLVMEERAISQIVELSAKSYHLQPTSNTFHGRDIFAPVAAYLSLGISAQAFGKRTEEFARLQWPRPQKKSGALEGEIVYIDRFGNLITNIEARDLNSRNIQDLRLTLGSIEIRGLQSNYASGHDRDYITLINSWGFLEVATCNDSAQHRSGAKIGNSVIIENI